MRIPGFGGMMKRFEQQMQALQETMENTELVATALEDKVRLVAKGTGEYLGIHIDPSLLAPEHQESLQAGILEALQGIREQVQQLGMDQMMSGLIEEE